MADSIDLDDIMTEIGSFGKYQIHTFAFLMIAIVVKAMYSTQYVFCAGPVEYRCKVPQCESSPPKFSAKPWDKFALPSENDDCYRKVAIGTTCEASSFSNEIERCYSWVYENHYTIVSDFGLACQEWKRTLVGSVHSFAYFTALPVLAFCSDTFGRRRVFIFTAVAPALLGAVRAFVYNYYVYLVLEYFESFAGCGTFSTGFILGLELVTVNNRVVAGNSLSITFAIGQACLGFIAWIVPHWRTLTLVIYTPSFLFISYCWILEESIRWLLSKGRKEEAVRIILKAAKVNNRKLSLKSMAMLSSDSTDDLPRDDDNQKPSDNQEPKTSSVIKQVLKSKTLLCRVCVCSFWWITITTVYYGLSINSVSLAGNRYANFILSALIEIPGYTLSMITLDRFGRKSSILTAFMICGISLISSGIIIRHPSIIIALTMLGKLCISMIFCSIYIYTIELFPTQARHMLMSACSMMGRVGHMTAPQTPLLMKYMKIMPNLIFGCMAVVAGFLMTLTPETLRIKLPDTIKQAENMNIMPRTRQRTDLLNVDKNVEQ